MIGHRKSLGEGREKAMGRIMGTNGKGKNKYNVEHYHGDMSCPRHLGKSDGHHKK
jgi:hypothetical protein